MLYENTSSASLRRAEYGLVLRRQFISSLDLDGTILKVRTRITVRRGFRFGRGAPQYQS